MKQVKQILSYSFFIFVMLFVSCKKDDIVQSPNNGNPPGQGTNNPNNPGNGQTIPDSVLILKVKSVIKIGEIAYDSIPASLQIKSWDSNQVVHQTMVNLVAGTNDVRVNKSHIKYELKLSKWGIDDSKTLTRQEVNTATVIELGGSKAAKKLRMEEGYLFAGGNYRPDSKSVYEYNSNGTINRIDYYQKRPQHSDLKMYFQDMFIYSGKKVQKINRLDENGTKVGVTEFTYNAGGSVVNIHQKSYDQETGAVVEYTPGLSNGNIEIDYLYSNGNTMVYKMIFRGGNKVEDIATSSRGGSEGGTYHYDTNINPFAHMNMPNIFLSNLSKNNLINQQKYYAGSIPSGVPYRYEYQYEADGYPKELVRSFKSYLTNEELYKIKTIYTYLD
jgi:hypothetical protein